MENLDLIEQLKTLAQNEDALAVNREVNDLKAKFDDFLLELERKEQVASLNAQVNNETYEPKDFSEIKNNFYELYNIYRARRKEQVDAKNAIESENLKQKRHLIERLKALINSEENIGAAYSTYKEIHDAWKKTGDIARDKRNEIQHEYSRLLEDFFYNIKIYRELKEHDLKRNYQLKQEVIEQLKQLAQSNVVKDLEQKLKNLQNDWEGIGPVQNEEWEKLKETYWATVRELYEKINAFYENRRTTLQENIQKKKELIALTQDLVNNAVAFSNTKDWDHATEKLLNFQEAWKAIGFGPKKENEEIWQEFRGLCDQFFASKKAFYGTIQEKNSEIANAKLKIIEAAKALKDSTDWKSTSEKLIQLQKQWKSSGVTNQKQEQKLWAEFRGACDAFFNSKQKHFEEQDQQLETNLMAKQQIIAQIENYTLADDKKQALNDLKEFTNTFNAVGKVPMKEKDAIYNKYKTAIDQLYTQLKLEGAEKEKILYQARIDTLAASPDANRSFAKEKADLRQQIQVLKNDVLQYENNLGFFARSKGADAMKKEVESKINAAKNKIDALIRKMNMIPNE